MINAKKVHDIVDQASEAYRRCPKGLRDAVLRSSLEVVPALDKTEASTELGLAAAAAVSAGLFRMVALMVGDNDDERALFRVAYFQLVARAIDNMERPLGSVQ